MEAGARSGLDPVCGMRPKSDTPHRVSHEGEELLFCSAGCKTKFEADPAKYTQAGSAHHEHQATSTGASKASSCREMDLPDASRDRAGWSGLVPDLRHGAGADDAERGRRPQPRTWRHVAALSGLALALAAAGSGAGDGPALVQRRCDRAACISMPGCSSSSRRRWCCGPVGRSSRAAVHRCKRAISTCSR